VISGKYQFGMPLYHTAVLLRRLGGLIEQHPGGRLVRHGRATQSVINLLRDHFLDADLIYGDDVTVRCSRSLDQKAQTNNYMWEQWMRPARTRRFDCLHTRPAAVRAQWRACPSTTRWMGRQPWRETGADHLQLGSPSELSELF